MILHQNVAHLIRPLSSEHILAHNSGRRTQAKKILEMLKRLDAVGRLDPKDATFKLVTDQATALLGEIWAARPVSLEEAKADDDDYREPVSEDDE